MSRTRKFERRPGWRLCSLAGLGVALLALGGCGLEGEASYPQTITKGRIDPAGSNKPRETIFGEGGFNFFGSNTAREDQGGGGGGIGVNGFLWRASLDSVSFMPLAQADPFGGVILTDWYSPPETPGERFKVNVFILGRELRADGVKVAVFRQRRETTGDWIDAPVETRTVVDLENTILTRARQLRIDTARP